MAGKLIIISAPSGTGKTTIVNEVMKDPSLRLQFSISATTRPPRGTEQNGVEYYFLSVDEFRREIEADAFAEYEEVYPGRYYGTLKREIARINEKGNNAILDVDVMGGLRVKRIYGDHARPALPRCANALSGAAPTRPRRLPSASPRQSLNWRKHQASTTAW